jgi:hypothetical protein
MTKTVDVNNKEIIKLNTDIMVHELNGWPDGWVIELYGEMVEDDEAGDCVVEKGVELL